MRSRRALRNPHASADILFNVSSLVFSSTPALSSSELRAEVEQAEKRPGTKKVCPRGTFLEGGRALGVSVKHLFCRDNQTEGPGQGKRREEMKHRDKGERQRRGQS